MAQQTITLQIAEVSPRGDFLFHVRVDGRAIASNHTVAGPQARAMRGFAEQFNRLFESRFQPAVESANLQALGAELFSIWLKEDWDEIQRRLAPGSSCMLVVASDVPAALNLPWEILCPLNGEFVGFSPRYAVRRHPVATDLPAAPGGPLRPRPLHVLFAACAPKEQVELDYEREEQALLRAVALSGPSVVLDSCDLGSFEELRDRIGAFQPHVVHLTGHGIVRDDGLGYFAFEDEHGDGDLRSSVEMRQQLFGGSGVQCAFISGCQTGKAPPVAALDGICQGLVGEGVPLAIGWAASVADDVATQFAATFYRTLANGQPADRALLQARQAIRKLCEQRRDPSWTLPVLYAATAQQHVVDPDASRREPPPRTGAVQQALPGMTEGYAETFIGRRREIQRLPPSKRDGTIQAALLTGLGGAGKSTLATRLARKLEADGFLLIPVPGNEPLDASRLLESCADAFRTAARHERASGDTQRAAMFEAAAAGLGNPEVVVAARLRDLVAVLNEGRFVLVLDNFEVNLNEGSGAILDAEIAAFYRHLLTNLTSGSRAIITSRYPPSDLASLPHTVHEESLADFPEASFLKLLLRDAEVERRYSSRELPQELLHDLYRLLGGTPRFLKQIREVLRTIDAAELRRELDNVRLPFGADAGALRSARDGYCEQIFTARLVERLSPASRRALQGARGLPRAGAPGWSCSRRQGAGGVRSRLC